MTAEDGKISVSIEDMFREIRQDIRAINDKMNQIAIHNARQDEQIMQTKECVDRHKNGHWKFAGLIITSAGVVVAVINLVMK